MINYKEREYKMYDQVWAPFTSGILSNGDQRRWREGMDGGFIAWLQRQNWVGLKYL